MIKHMLRAAALWTAAVVLTSPCSASEVGSYPNAAALTGTERILADQNAVTVNLTPAQINAYILLGVSPYSFPFNNNGALTGLMPSSAGTYCLQWGSLSAPPVIASCPSGSFQVNGTALSSTSPINFENSATFNGLTFTFTNPSAGNIQLGASGQLTNAGLQFSSVTLNGQAVALGSSGNVNNGAPQYSIALNAGSSAAIGGIALPGSTGTYCIDYASLTANPTLAACSGGGGITLQTNSTNNSSQTELNIENGQGIVCTNPSSGNVQCGTNAAERTVTTSPTVASTDMGGQIVLSASGLTVTIPAISSSLFAAGQSLSLLNYATTFAAISNTPAIQSGGGCSAGNGVTPNGSWQLLSNGTALDCIQTISSLNAPVNAATSATSVTPNCAYNIVKVTASTTGTFTVNAPATCTPVGGQKLLLKITSPSGGTLTYAWNATYHASSSLPLPTASLAASTMDYFQFVYDADNSKWDFLAYNQGF